jgi:CheY-like chemotaxis protein
MRIGKNHLLIAAPLVIVVAAAFLGAFLWFGGSEPAKGRVYLVGGPSFLEDGETLRGLGYRTSAGNLLKWGLGEIVTKIKSAETVDGLEQISGKPLLRRLIFMDAKMADETFGQDAYLEFRSNFDIKVIFFFDKGSSNIPASSMGKALVVNDYITKPFTKENLEAAFRLWSKKKSNGLK